MVALEGKKATIACECLENYLMHGACHPCLKCQNYLLVWVELALFTTMNTFKVYLLSVQVKLTNTGERLNCLVGFGNLLLVTSTGRMKGVGESEMNHSPKITLE